MTVYHGSTTPVLVPEIRPITRPMDFGAGFYTTTLRARAENWANRLALKQKALSVVTIYELDFDLVKRSLQTHTYRNANEAWLQFVLKHRGSSCYDVLNTPEGYRLVPNDNHHKYDAVYGEVADDTVFDAITNYETGVLSKEGLLQRLRTKEHNDQLCLCTPSALTYLCYKSHYTVGGAD